MGMENKFKRASNLFSVIQRKNLIVPITVVFSAHIVNFLANPDGVIHPDSFGYGLSVGREDVAYPGLRSKVIVAIYSMLGSAERIVFVQHLFAFSVECYFISRVSLKYCPAKSSVAYWSFALFFIIPPIISVHSALLSESLVISFSVLLVSRGTSCQFAEVNGYYPADTLFGHCNTINYICAGHGAFVVGNKNKLAFV